MVGIAKNRQKCFIFIADPLLRIENIKERLKNRKIYSKYKVLNIVTVGYAFH